MLPGYLIR